MLFWNNPAKKARTQLKAQYEELQRLYKRARKKLPEAVRVDIEKTVAETKMLLKDKPLEHPLHAMSDRIDACVETHLKTYRRHPWVEGIASVAWAMLVALTLRAFVVEAFRIPSGSMIPTLSIGDQIFVNKLLYGVRVPFTSVRLWNFSEPERGEVVVFIFPEKPSQDYIKRVVGVPGDEIEVKAGQLYVNGVAVPRRSLGHATHWDRDAQGDAWREVSAERFEETLDGHRYTVLKDVPEGYVQPDYGPYRVPKDSLFVMGDNRDHSYDSRYWGVVPMSHVLGKALFVWWSWGHAGLDLKRLGHWLE